MVTHHHRSRTTALLAVLLATLTAVIASAPAGRSAASDPPPARWTTAWGASPVIGVTNPYENCPAGTGLTDQTVRNVLFLSAAGDAVRVRLSNSFGTQAMTVDHATVAVQASGAAARPGTVRTLTFDGQRAVTMVAGGQALSDPLPMRVAALSTLLVSVYVAGPTGPVTNHPFTAQGNYLGTGDLSAATTGTGYADSPCWMFVDGVDVHAPARYAGAVVALGDSITDTANTTGNANKRWPDDLARRLDAAPGSTLSVVNAGLGGNRLLAPRVGEDFYGVPAGARLDRDVLTQTGARTVILFEGVNDIGYDATAAQLISAAQQLAAQTHARGLRILGATVTPFGGSFLDTPAREQVRQTFNTWIRTTRAFDAVLDFDHAVLDPANPHALLPTYDSGDHLHPNDAGCRAIADSIPLHTLR
jgi:lysophospholipase L1-like esterase